MIGFKEGCFGESRYVIHTCTKHNNILLPISKCHFGVTVCNLSEKVTMNLFPKQ